VALEVKSSSPTSTARFGSAHPGIGSIIDLDAGVYGAGGRNWRLISGGAQTGPNSLWSNLFIIRDEAVGANRLVIDPAGNVGIQTASPAATLDVNGNIKAAGSIDGGSIKATYQDIAEWVPARNPIAVGTVVSVDLSRANAVAPSARAYDAHVAGVISEKPGVILGRGGEGKVLVATTGRVRIKVDATRHPIRIGDLLVTSDKLGIAMRSQPIRVGHTLIHRPGTIIGKALESLANGQGEIKVLLSLQ
jgi:hypothetical protein